ncbi:maleate cis-trans isomerase family protein [Neptunicoccus cionae]|uniref:maleate cis-trans isomerase family protein n=1 Tax=Neptunicoccus cionae TaxID=2035344 RepID=UPI000C78F5AF|nr:aspartate/glutamate racemase family protein [Amylibacter cionae]PLS23541.1 Asp/Glu racemase [Amylibacter cionae]
MAQQFETDQGYGDNAALGLIVLSTDETMEPELSGVFGPARVPVYHSRLPSQADVTPETLAQMEADLPASAALLPQGVSFGAIGYGCTSGATIIGEDRVAACVHTSHAGVPVTNPMTAVMAACRALGAEKIGFLTPYVADVSAAMRKLLEENGFAITGFTSFEEGREKVVARIAESSVLAAVEELGQGDCDLVFASCTNLRAFNIIEQAEARIGKPVISSNSALAWHLAHLAGRNVPGPGRLFRL